MKKEKLLLIWSPSKSPGHLQTVNAWIELVRDFQLKNVQSKRILKFLDLFKYLKKKVKIIIYSPALINIPFAFFSRLLGYEVYNVMHEPYPISFLLKRKSKIGFLEFLKSIFISYFYNPALVFLSDGIIFPSQTSSLILNSNFCGIILRFFKKKEYFINLFMPKYLNDYRNCLKEDKVCLAGSLNKDKGLSDIIMLSKLNPEVKFSVLCTKNALHSLYDEAELYKIKCENPNIEFKAKDRLSDSEIYSHISSSVYIILFYSHITQSQVLPIALGTGTIPIFTDLIYFKNYCFNFQENVIIWDLKPGLNEEMSKINIKKSSQRLIDLYEEKVDDSSFALKDLLEIKNFIN